MVTLPKFYPYQLLFHSSLRLCWSTAHLLRAVTPFTTQLVSDLGETGAPLDMGYLETGLFDTEIILRFVRHLVNGTKTNQFLFSSLLLMAIGHVWYACKLTSSFFGSSIFGSLL